MSTSESEIKSGEPSKSDEDSPTSLGLTRSLAVLGGIVLTVLVIFFWQGHEGSNGSESTSGLQGGGHSDLQPPKVFFTDITQSAGIGFVHENGACGEKLLPETMGGGVAFFDFDNDGDADLLFINGKPWPECDNDGARAATAELYRNDTPENGPVQFTNVTPGSGLDTPIYGMGVAIGDYDNDGLADVFVTAVGANRLFKNLGQGKFEDVTETAGVEGASGEWSTSAAFLDVDNDGDLDLFVCNYVHWSRDIDLAVDYQLPGIGKAYGPPLHFSGTFPYLYRNDGNGAFTDVTAESGLRITNRATGQPLAKSLGVAPLDLDHDGWMDLIIANDTVQNLVFRNQRDGTFKEIGASSGIAFDSFGGPRGAMGIDTAWTTKDNQLAIAIGNFANEMTALYVSQPLDISRQGKPAIQYSDQAIAHGIGVASREVLTFGVFFFDYDLDGWEDLLTVNGHIEPEVQTLDANQHYRQPAQLFWNAKGQDSGFLLVTESSAGADLFEPIVGRGSAFADIDRDGDLDVVMTQIGGPAKLLRNDQNLGHHWLRFKLVGKTANRDAIGAAIRIVTPERTLWRRVMPTRGYLSQSELPITVGLGKNNVPPEIEVLWPGGGAQSVSAAAIDDLLEIRQP